MKQHTRKRLTNNDIIGRLLLPVIVILTVNIVLPADARAGPAANGLPSAPHYYLDIAVDQGNGKIKGTADIIASPGATLIVYPNETTISELRTGHNQIAPDEIKGKDKIFITAEGPIHIAYEAAIDPSENNVISEQEIILSHNWYPTLDGFYTYHFRADLPTDFIAVSEGETAPSIRRGDRQIFTFEFPHPYSGEITLTASQRFVVAQDVFGPVRIYTYLYREDAHRSFLFMEWTKRYLERYQALIGPFPYTRFSIVESSRPSACSMPTYIWMTQSYIREGNVEETPLGHEIVHQWFGNSIFSDFDLGNWIEGLTIYFADLFDAERRGKAADYRKRILMGFENYVRENNVFPLIRFMARFDDASRSIGYGKSAFVFHMLRKRFGDEVFFNGIKRFFREHAFRVATWDDIQEIFEKDTGADLKAFFQQWVNEVGIPELELTDIQFKTGGSGEEVRFTVRQKGTIYALQIPTTIYTKKGRQTVLLTVDRGSNRFIISVEGEPEEIVLDEGFDVFRRLTVAETPPLIERLITDEKIIIIRPPFSKDLYTSAFTDLEKKGGVLKIMPQPSDAPRRDKRVQAREKVDQEQTMPYWDAKANQLSFRMERPWRQMPRTTMPDKGPGFLRQGLLRETAQLTDQDIASSSLLILGADTPILARFGIEVEKNDAGFGISLRKNPLNPRKVVAIAIGKTKEEIDLGWPKVADYPKYSDLRFDQGKLVRKERLPAVNGIRKTLK